MIDLCKCPAVSCTRIRKAFDVLIAERDKLQNDVIMLARSSISHICCEECQNNCDHEPGFGFDDGETDIDD